MQKKIVSQLRGAVMGNKIGIDKIFGGILAVLAVLAGSSSLAYATVNPWDFMATPAPPGAAFEEATTLVKETSQSLYGAVVAGGVAAMLMGLVFIAIGIALTKNSAKKAESKSQLLWYVFGAIVFFGGFVILAFSKKIADGLA